MTQEKLANAADITTYTYRKLRRESQTLERPANPRLRTLVALALVLEVELAELLPPMRLAGDPG